MFRSLKLLVPVAIVAGLLFSRAAADPPSRFALLIGVNEYANLPASKQLGGAINDVRLMREILQSRFGFARSEIRELRGAAATGDAIRDAMSDLAQEVRDLLPEQKPAQVVLHFSGHGGQLPDQLGNGRDETDGLDETLVPADATMIGGAEDIRDDELNRWSHLICDEGNANLWIVLDCCHSGTGTRNAGSLDAPGLLGFRALQRPLTPTETEIPADSNTLPENAVALYACRDQELEPEYFDGEQRYGLLTRFMTSVLADLQTDHHLSYAGLRDAIAVRYRQDRRVGAFAPVPLIEGSPKQLTSGVLGGTAQRAARYWNVDATAGKPTLLAGAFHGVTRNAIYQLFESPDLITGRSGDDEAAADVSRGQYVRVAEVEATSSKLEAVYWEGKRWELAAWPVSLKRAYAVLELRGDSDFGLSVLVSTDSGGSHVNPICFDKLPNALKAVFTPKEIEPRRDPWLRFTTDPADADLMIKLANKKIAVFPVTAHRVRQEGEVRNSNALLGGWGPVDLRDGSGSGQIRELLERLTKARNLLRIVGHGQSGGEKPIDVSIELMQYDPKNPHAAAEPWPNESPTRTPPTYTMRTGDCYRYRVTNRGQKPAFISVLHVNADMGIEQVFPYQAADGIQGADDSEVRAGESKLLPAFQCNGDGVESYGTRHTVVIATAKPNLIYMLSQPSLPAVRSFGENQSLADLLMSAAYFRTRSRRRPVKLYDDSWGADAVQWVVQP